MRDAVRDAVAAHGLDMSLTWEKRDSNEETVVAAKSAAMIKEGEVHVSSLTKKQWFEGWTGAKTRFADVHGCAVRRPQGSKQTLAGTRVPRRGRVQRAFAAALMHIRKHECEQLVVMTNESDIQGALLPKTPQVESATGTRPICLLPGPINIACYVL